MTEMSKKKTLTLQRKPAQSPEGTGKPRKRSGARARNVAQQELTKQKYAAPAPVAPEPAEKAPARKRERKPNVTQAQTFQVFVPCPHGLEMPLSLELQALGFDTAEAGRAGCRLKTDWTGIMRINLFSRLATRVLVQVSHAPVRHEEDIFDLAYHTPWERWFGAEQTLRVDTSAIRSPMKSLQFCNLRTKDAICDRLRDQEGERPSIDTVRPDARVHLFLDETSATLYLDTSGESLFKRGWRLDKGEAPIRENLAAGLLALSGWNPDAPLLDPFCGSGTIMIEAAWIALGVPPGIWRPFAFERLRDHPFRHWRDIKDEAREAIRTQLETPLLGTDIDPQAIAAAKQNQERARLAPDTVRFEVADARNVVPPGGNGWLVTNPPYGERLPDEELTLWQEWASNLKQHYDGWHVHIISNDLGLPQKMRLKPLKRYPIHNGALDCRLFGFDMVKDQYRT
ncbi:MAG: RNA methyltransferase [Pusillimonas sp.]|nr:RNA methyltransferase [Pusillimonas sp.]HCP77907.1 RNA methyltransferase [Pusillimonas sp.]|tara:strand:- start:114713 stop:116077 length:1365 start_codon:yes stop_codon:yes gene_type:complete